MLMKWRYKYTRRSNLLYFNLSITWSRCYGPLIQYEGGEFSICRYFSFRGRAGFYFRWLTFFFDFLLSTPFFYHFSNGGFIHFLLFFRRRQNEDCVYKYMPDVKQHTYYWCFLFSSVWTNWRKYTEIAFLTISYSPDFIEIRISSKAL